VMALGMLLGKVRLAGVRTIVRLRARQAVGWGDRDWVAWFFVDGLRTPALSGENTGRSACAADRVDGGAGEPGRVHWVCIAISGPGSAGLSDVTVRPGICLLCRSDIAGVLGCVGAWRRARLIVGDGGDSGGLERAGGSGGWWHLCSSCAEGVAGGYLFIGDDGGGGWRLGVGNHERVQPDRRIECFFEGV